MRKNKKEIEDYSKKIEDATVQENKMSENLKVALDKAFGSIDEYKGLENREKRKQKTSEIFDSLTAENIVLEEEIPETIKTNRRIYGLVQGIKAVGQLRSQANQIVELKKEIENITSQLASFQERLKLIEEKRREVILETDQKKEDSRAVVEKRKHNLSQLKQLKIIQIGGGLGSDDGSISTNAVVSSPTSLPSGSSPSSSVSLSGSKQ